MQQGQKLVQTSLLACLPFWSIAIPSYSPDLIFRTPFVSSEETLLAWVMQGIGLVVLGIMKSPIVGIRFFSQQKYFISPDGIMAMSYGLQGWSKKNPSLSTRLGLHLPSNSTALPGWGGLQVETSALLPKQHQTHEGRWDLLFAEFLWRLSRILWTHKQTQKKRTFSVAFQYGSLEGRNNWTTIWWNGSRAGVVALAHFFAVFDKRVSQISS